MRGFTGFLHIVIKGFGMGALWGMLAGASTATAAVATASAFAVAGTSAMVGNALNQGAMALMTRRAGPDRAQFNMRRVMKAGAQGLALQGISQSTKGTEFKHHVARAALTEGGRHGLHYLRGKDVTWSEVGYDVAAQTFQSYTAQQIGLYRPKMTFVEHKLWHGLSAGLAQGLLTRNRSEMMLAACSAMAGESMAESTMGLLLYRDDQKDPKARKAREAYITPVSAFSSWACTVGGALAGYDSDIIERRAQIALQYNFQASYLVAMAAMNPEIWPALGAVVGAYGAWQLGQWIGSVFFNDSSSSPEPSPQGEAHNNTGNSNNPDPNKTPGKGLVVLSASSAASNSEVQKRFIKTYRELKNFIEDRVQKSDLQKIKDYIRNYSGKRLKGQELDQHQKQCNMEKLIKEWEKNNNKQWPNHPANLKKTNGTPHPSAEKRCQGHHIIPQEFRGPHEAWNITPIQQPYHQGGIHGKGSQLRQLIEFLEEIGKIK